MRKGSNKAWNIDILYFTHNSKCIYHIVLLNHYFITIEKEKEKNQKNP